MTEAPSYEHLWAVSGALFGNAHLLPTVFAILAKRAPRFLSRELSYKDSGKTQALNRLAQLGAIERRDIGSLRAREYECLDSEGKLWDFFRLVHELYEAHCDGQSTDRHPPLRLVADPNQDWFDRLDVDVARRLTGGLYRTYRLIELYQYAHEFFWASEAYVLGYSTDYLGEFLKAGLIAQTDQRQRDYQQYQVIDSPLWLVVVELWELYLTIFGPPKVRSTTIPEETLYRDPGRRPGGTKALIYAKCGDDGQANQAIKSLEYAASDAIFCDELFALVARQIIDFRGKVFAIHELGLRRSEVLKVVTRLRNLNLIEAVDSRRYRVRSEATFSKIIEAFYQALEKTQSGEPYRFAALEPPLECFGPGYEWSEWVDQVGARLVAGHAVFVGGLIGLYHYPSDRFWLNTQQSIHGYALHLEKIGMMQREGAATPYGYQRWIRLPSPLWSMVPLIWNYLYASYSYPKAVSSQTAPTIFADEPKMPAIRLACPDDDRY